MNPYISDILSQPATLRNAVQVFSPAALRSLVERIQGGDFDRIVLTGMGASYHAGATAYVHLSGLPVPVFLVNAAELVHYLSGQVGTRTLLWINSQSGRSAELKHLLERISPQLPACLLACVNDETSPLALAADICLPIHAGPEATVSTKTYLNTLAVNLLAARQVAGYEVETFRQEMLSIADRMEAWLGEWGTRVRELDAMLGDFDELLILGRGASMSAVGCGALINKEAAKCAFEGMQAADFRHGPLELVAPGFRAMLFAGSQVTSALNRNLAFDIVGSGGQVIWLDVEPAPGLPTFLLPPASDLARPLVEILPMQLLTLVMAERKGIAPGEFRVVGKVTTKE
ncbi:MAG: SIS domain-containing protein [Chloroflexota bacterium]